jgi:hypothetical protein
VKSLSYKSPHPEGTEKQSKVIRELEVGLYKKA